MRIKAVTALFAAFVVGWVFSAGAQVAVPPLTGRVVDQTATLGNEQKAALEQTLQAFEARKGSQIAVLIVPTNEPETIEQYALRVAEQWKVGRKKVDDGAVLVVAKNDRAVRIEVGYGLEGVLTDATSKRIISEIIVPQFQQGDFYGGIRAGVERMISVIDGEPLPPPQRSAAADTDMRQLLPIIVLLAIVGGSVLRAALGRFPGSIVTGGAVAVVTWLLAGAAAISLVAGVIAFLLTLFGGGGMGRHGGWYGGGGHYGGLSGGFGGGGGFRGGGGSFGGGGSSGRW